MWILALLLLPFMVAVIPFFLHRILWILAVLHLVVVHSPPHGVLILGMVFLFDRHIPLLLRHGLTRQLFAVLIGTVFILMFTVKWIVMFTLVPSLLGWLFIPDMVSLSTIRSTFIENPWIEIWCSLLSSMIQTSVIPIDNNETSSLGFPPTLWYCRSS